MAAGLTRVGAVLVLGVLGVAVLWPRLALAGMPPEFHGRPLPPGLSPTFNEAAARVVAQHAGASLAVLAAGAVLGVLVGLGGAAIRAAATVGGGQGGGVVGGLGWLVGTLWTLPSPVVIVMPAVALTVALHGNLAQVAGLPAVFALAGLVAVLVAMATGEVWGRSHWAAGAFAAAAAALRGLGALAGALLVVEVILAFPGLGSLVDRAVDTRDGTLFVAAATPLLVIALLGQLLGTGAAVVRTLVEGATPAGEESPSHSGIAWTVLCLTTLGIPTLVLLLSLLTLGTPATDVRHVLQGPSVSHLLGTDPLGRDLLAELLSGFRQTWLTSVGAVVPAVVLGGAWGGVAALLRRVPDAGASLAELLLAPGRLIMVAPLLVAGAILTGADQWAPLLALLLVLVPRVAVAVNDLAVVHAFATSAAAVKTWLGLTLCTLGITLAVLTGLQVLGLASRPPAPALGTVLAQGMQVLQTSGMWVAALVLVLVTTAPFLLAGWVLLHSSGRGEALTTLAC